MVQLAVGTGADCGMRREGCVIAIVVERVGEMSREPLAVTGGPRADGFSAGNGYTMYNGIPSSHTVGSRSTYTARGTCLPAPVSEKKVLKASSPPPIYRPHKEAGDKMTLMRNK